MSSLSRRQWEIERVLLRQNANKITSRNNITHNKLLKKQRLIRPPMKQITRTETVLIPKTPEPGMRQTTSYTTETRDVLINNPFSPKNRLMDRSRL
jgi:murein tripeptide amidase MpaA